MLYIIYLFDLFKVKLLFESGEKVTKINWVEKLIEWKCVTMVFERNNQCYTKKTTKIRQ